MNPNEDKLFQVALDHLEDQWPAKVEDLLQRNQLRPHLEHQVEQTWRLRKQLSEQNPPLQPVEVDELSLPVFVAPRNPEYNPENPQLLSPKAQKGLNQFRQDNNLPSRQPLSLRLPNPSQPTPTPSTTSLGQMTS